MICISLSLSRSLSLLSLSLYIYIYIYIWSQTIVAEQKVVFRGEREEKPINFIPDPLAQNFMRTEFEYGKVPKLLLNIQVHFLVIHYMYYFNLRHVLFGFQ